MKRGVECNAIKLYITKFCPMDCDYCFVKEKTRGKIMKQQVLKSSIKYFLDTHWKYKKIYFMWWEPLTEQNLIIDAINYINSLNISDKNITIIIVTWGLILPCEKLQRLIKNNNIILSISIDGFKQQHDTHRYIDSSNKKGTYDIIIKNLKSLDLDIKPKVWIAFTVFPEANVINQIFRFFLYFTQTLWFKFCHVSMVQWVVWEKDLIKSYVIQTSKILDFIIFHQNWKYKKSYLAFFNRSLLRNSIPDFQGHKFMLDIDYNWDVWKVFMMENEKKLDNIFFNIMDEDISKDSFLKKIDEQYINDNNYGSISKGMEKVSEKYFPKIQKSYIDDILAGSYHI